MRDRGALVSLPAHRPRRGGQTGTLRSAGYRHDVSSSYYEGHTCPLMQFGHDRDGKRGKPIVVYGVLADVEGRPIAVQVYAGNTGDPKTVPDQVERLRTHFGLSRVVLVGDRGMLTETQIEHLRHYPGLGWISALRSEAIRALLCSTPQGAGAGLLVVGGVVFAMVTSARDKASQEAARVSEVRAPQEGDRRHQPSAATGLRGATRRWRSSWTIASTRRRCPT